MTQPKLIATAFAETGARNDIPESGASEPQRATMQTGFPQTTATPISEGGIPPEREDFNGAFHLTTSHLSYLNKGMWYKYDSAYAGQIGGYPLHARLLLDNGDIVQSTINGNTNNPNVSLDGWKLSNKNTVESTDELVLIRSPANGDVVFVKSRILGKNRGGGFFEFFLSSNNNDDGKFFKTATGSWHRINIGIMTNIDWYGALPEPGFDSTIAIEKAGLSNPNSQINVPVGKYEITRELSTSLKCSYIGELGSSIYELASEFLLKGSTAFTLLKQGSKVQFENMCITGGEYGVAPIHTLAEYWDVYGSVPLRNCRIRRFSDLGTISTTYIDFYDVFISECKDTFYISQIPNGESATVIGFHSVRFTYSKNGVQTKERPSSSMIPAIGVYFYNCGFENLDNYGVSGNLLAVKVADSWFENVKGKYNVTSSTVIQEANNAEYFTGASIGLNKSICSNINGIYSYLPRLEIVDYLTAPRIQSKNPILIDKGIRFADQYIGGGGSNVISSGQSVQQVFTSDGGGCSAAMEFRRTNQGGSSVFMGSSIVFRTGRLTDYTPDPIVDQWTIDGYGNLIPARNNNISVGSKNMLIDQIHSNHLFLPNLAVFSDNVSAKTGGLVAGDVYRTSIGQIMVVF